LTDRTITEHAQRSGSGPLQEPRLGVVVVHSRGPVVPIPFEVIPEVIVGRDPTNPVFVDDAGVSREHARIEQRGNALWVSDLGSRNGTWVNAERVAAHGAPAFLGSVIRVGRTLMVVANVAPYAEPRPGELPGLIGGAALDDARYCVQTIAPTRSPVLILGDTGTGKEVIAGLVHAQSGRAGPYVALNCAAVPSELVDAELFGHARGAFSGAAAARTGLFRTAHLGTLFLDEIGEMPAPVQAKLLRTLETGEVRPVGEDRPVQVDVRVVAATNREVDQLIESGTFRGDLLHRLAGLRIMLPALRERLEDVPVLAEHFIQGSGMTFSAAALERMLTHTYPGNVRELRNLATTALELARRHGHPEIDLEDVAGLLAPPRGRMSSASEEQLLAARVTEALTAAAGDVAAAAGQLGVSRSSLYETLRRLNIDPRPFRRR